NFAAATLTGASFAGADLRGANSLDPTGTVTTNSIGPDGRVHGLDLTSGGLLEIQNYNGDPTRGDRIFGAAPLAPIAIMIEQSFVADSTSTLKLTFDGNPWHSTISFSLGIPVELNGTLDLEFAQGIDLAGEIGRTFKIFDWTGTSPIGVFAIGG